MKNCIKCNKPVDNRVTTCRKCWLKSFEETKEERKLQKKKKQKEWYLKNRDRLLKKQAERFRNYTFEQRKHYTIKDKYGISIEDFNKMLKKFNNRCNICDKEHSEDSPLHIDHCHKTKFVRGLLCESCNFALGYLKDSISVIKKSIIYLEQYEKV